MKKYTTFVCAFLFSTTLLLAQEAKDSVANFPIHPHEVFDKLSDEESLEIMKAAYQKKLSKEGKSEAEIQKLLKDYEDQWAENLEKFKERRRLAAKHREMAAQQRRMAAKQREMAAIQREKAAVMREKAAAQREVAKMQREIAAEQRERASEMRKIADKRRAIAEEQRHKAQMMRKSFKSLITREVSLNKKSKDVDPFTFTVDSKMTLRIGIYGRINNGSALAEVFDPKGNKIGELSLEHGENTGDSKDYSTGSLEKNVWPVETGEWQVKISPQKAEGQLKISVAQYSNEKKDE